MAARLLFFFLLSGLIVAIAAARPIGDTTLLSIGEAAAPSFETVPVGAPGSRDQPIGDTTLLSIGEAAASSSETAPVGAPESRDQHGAKGHRSSAKSAIGGEAILGGLILAILLTILAYIRVTRKSNLGYKSDKLMGAN